MSLKKPSELFEQRRNESLEKERALKKQQEDERIKNKKIASPKELFGEVIEVEDSSIVEEVVEVEVKVEDNTKEDLTGFVEEKIGKQTEEIRERLKEKFEEYSEQFEDKTKKYYQNLANQFNGVKENLIKKVSSLEVDILRNEHHLRNNNVDVDEIRQDINETIQKIKSEIIEDVGVLQEPPSNVTSDPLTPLDQNFVTFDHLNDHYRLFLNRVQQQLTTLGGGGETRLEFLDDVDRDSVKVDGRFLKYDAASGKWIGALGGGGGSQTLNDTLGLGNTSSLGMSVGVVTATYFVGDGSLLTNVPGSVNNGYANTAGIATYATRAGISTYASTSGISTVAQGLTGTPNIVVGVVTATKYYGDGSGLTGIVATGSGVAIQDDGANVGTAATLNFNDNISVSLSGGVATINSAGGISSTSSINTTGIITANSYYVGSTQVINSAGQWVGSGLSVYSNIDGGVPNSVYGGIPVIDGGGP